MICFFTSASTVPDTTRLNPANGFLNKLRASVPNSCRALFICSDPDAPQHTDGYAAETRAGFETEGFSFSDFRVLDRRTQGETAALVEGAELIVLAGGHVPTQNRFFAEIALGETLKRFDGVIVSISAGTMDSAECVYAMPELEGEASDEHFERFRPGLGLHRHQIIPHFQWLRTQRLEGLRMIEDIAAADSRGRSFLCLTDGSYILSENGRETLYGESYRLHDGELARICANEEQIVLN